jgi:hypothetical protein
MQGILCYWTKYICSVHILHGILCIPLDILLQDVIGVCMYVNNSYETVKYVTSGVLFEKVKGRGTMWYVTWLHSPVLLLLICWDILFQKNECCRPYNLQYGEDDCYSLWICVHWFYGENCNKNFMEKMKDISKNIKRNIFLNIVNCTELLGLFWTLSIVLYVEDKRPQRFRDWNCLRPQVDGAGQTYSVGPVRKS